MDIFERNHISISKLTKRDSAWLHYNHIKCRRLVLYLLRDVCLSKYRKFGLESKGSKIIFLIGVSSKRFTEEPAYQKIRNCAEERDEIYWVPKVSVANVPYNLYLIFKYYFRFKKQKKSLSEILLCLWAMIQTHDFLSFLEHQDLKEYKAAVVYNDLDHFDNIFVQYMKNMGVTTATCQHGMFSAPRPNGGLSLSGVELQNSIADILLAWNQMTYDEAILAGMAPSKIRILGIPKCIGSVRGTQHERRNMFGVVLNHPEFNAHNIQLLQVANYIAEKNRMKYYVKFHPATDLSTYDDYLDERYGMKLPKKTFVAEYADLVDFSILSHSTVYVELLFLRSKVYLLHVDNLCKFTHFPEYDFSSKEELDELIHKDYDVDKMFNYYCFTDDPKQEYTRFFKEIAKNNKT